MGAMIARISWRKALIVLFWLLVLAALCYWYWTTSDGSCSFDCG